MVKIRWTSQALDDVEAIANFIARDSEHYASMFVLKVFDVVERLRLFPESGRVVPELKRRDIREIIMGSYRIIYRVREDTVEILTVYHSARLLEAENIDKLL